MIRVEEAAQRTNAYQENRNLLLSNEAHADSIPGLEIMANDVRCTHGATLGRIDREELFYLMARGLSRAEAERLIVRGFFQDVLDRIELEPVRDAVTAALGDADLTFTAVPVARDNESVRERIMVIARNSGLAVHHVTVHDLGDKLTVSIDLEVDGGVNPETARRCIAAGAGPGRSTPLRQRTFPVCRSSAIMSCPTFPLCSATRYTSPVRAL